MRILNELQSYRLMGAINLRSPFGPRDLCLLKLALNTGLRVSELSLLDVEHVSRAGVAREILDLPPAITKFHRSRQIPLNAAARRVISELLAFNQARGFSVAPDAPLFQNRKHRRFSVRSIQLLVEHYRELAELDIKVTPHSLRHKFATDVLRAKGNVRVAQKLLGHRDIRTTELYLHPDFEDLAEAVAFLE
jgi:site-specific recombinase XerD